MTRGTYGMIPQASIGIAAALLSLVPSVFYLLAIAKGETKPDRVTWWVLALSSLMISSTDWAAGAHNTVWLPIAYCFGFLAVAVASLRYGEGATRLHALDRVCLGGVVIGAGLWWRLRSPATGLFVVMGVEFLGLIPTIVKSYLRPWTEDRRAWCIAALASLLNLFALDSWSTPPAAYAVYVALTNAFVAGLLLRPRDARQSRVEQA